MNLAGHNRGKKWVRGVGYCYPKIERAAFQPPRCICGEKATIFYSDGQKVCDTCDKYLELGR